MTKILLYPFLFILLLDILTYSACASTATEKARELRASKRLEQPARKLMYGMIMERSKLGNQKIIPGLHVVKHIETAEKAKAIYGGVNDPKRPRNAHNGANSISVKSSSLFLAALRHLVSGLLLWVSFF